MGGKAKRKIAGAVFVAAWLAAVAVFVWPRASAPHEVEFVAQGRSIHGERTVVLRLTNHTSSDLKIFETGGRFHDITYHSADFDPSVDPIRHRVIVLTTRVRPSDPVEIPPRSSVEIIDEVEGHVPGGKLVACWSPPPGAPLGLKPASKFRSFRFRLSRAIHPGVITVGVTLPKKSGGWRERLARWIAPFPPDPVISEPFVVK